MPHQKTLIIGPAWVGDTIMAQSLFKLLKQRNPDAELHVLAPDWTASLLSCMPEVTQSFALPITHGEFKLFERRRIGKELQQHQYDHAIVLPNSFKSALIPWFANIPKRTGYIGEWRYGLLNDARRIHPKHQLMIEQYLALGVARDEALPDVLPFPEFTVEKTAQEAVLEKLQLKLDGSPILALAAGAEFGPSKRWPEEYYAAVALEKIKEGWSVWLFGSPKDRPITEKIMSLTNGQCQNISGRTVLSETIALISQADYVISNDSGLMHVAAALKKRLIAIYGSTSPSFTPPLYKQAKVLKLALDCQPCFQRECPLKHHRCMRDLSPDVILQAMSE
jgi:heptosyltransferase-2